MHSITKNSWASYQTHFLQKKIDKESRLVNNSNKVCSVMLDNMVHMGTVNIDLCVVLEKVFKSQGGP